MNAIAMSTENTMVAGSSVQLTPTAVCRSSTSSSAWADVTMDARPIAASTSLPLPAVDDSVRRLMGRITRNTASDPIQSPSGTNRVAMIWPGDETSFSRCTVTPTGFDTTVAVWAICDFVYEGALAAPDDSPDASDFAPEASDFAPPLSFAPPVARPSVLFANVPVLLARASNAVPTPLVTLEPPLATAVRVPLSISTACRSAGSVGSLASAVTSACSLDVYPETADVYGFSALLVTLFFAIRMPDCSSRSPDGTCETPATYELTPPASPFAPEDSLVAPSAAFCSEAPTPPMPE